VRVAIGSSNLNATLAALDLSLVRLLRTAMAPGAGSAVARLGPTPSPFSVRQNHRPDPVIEPRRHVQPTPRFEPRPVHHPEPRFSQREDRGLPPIVVLEPSPCRSKSPIEPPWKVLPWEKPLPPRPEIKVWVKLPDKTNSKGALIDLFC
jgi:hypothetical protein